MGVANDHSIAWGIARMLAAQGAEIAFTYQGDAQAKRLKPLAAGIGASLPSRKSRRLFVAAGGDPKP